MSVTTLFDLRFLPEALDEGLGVLRRILADTRAFDGNEAVAVVQDEDDPTHVIVVGTWASSARAAAYGAWRSGDGAVPELRGLLGGDPHLTTALPRDDV